MTTDLDLQSAIAALDEYGYVLSLQHEKCCEKKSEILHLAHTAWQNTTCSSL